MSETLTIVLHDTWQTAAAKVPDIPGTMDDAGNLRRAPRAA
jgi:hypothetical protein